MKTLERRLAALERGRPRRLPSPRDDFPWLDDAGVAKVACETLGAFTAFHEVTGDEQAAGDALTFYINELANRLKDDPAFAPEPLEEFEIVRQGAEPTIGRVLDAIGYTGPRRFPGELQRYVARRDCEDLGGRLLRPWPPGLPRDSSIKIPSQPSAGG